MKILQVVPYFYPAWFYGGPTKLVFDTSSAFVQQGNIVSVYTSDAYDNYKRMPDKLRLKPTKNLKVYYFSNVSNYLACFHNIFFTPGLILTAVQEIPQFDIIHLHDFYTFQNIVVTFFAWLYHKPYVISVHGCLEERRMDRHSFFKKLYLTLYGNQILQGAVKVIATSENEVKDYIKHGVPAKKIVSLTHGIQIEEFLTPTTHQAAKQHFHFARSETIVTFIGRIHEIKGLDLLVKAADKLRQQNIRIVIAGSDGGFLTQLKDLIHQYNVESKITLRGPCFGKEKALLFKASDIFIYPSYSEGFSLGILEAAAAGLPLIISTECHFPEVQKQNAGLVVLPNVRSLVIAINTLSRSSSIRRQKGRSAQQLIKKSYSLQVVAQELLQSYQVAIHNFATKR